MSLMCAGFRTQQSRIGFPKRRKKCKKKYSWVVIRHEIDYKKPAFENEEITVATWVGEPTRISWERFTEIKRGDDLLCKARSLWCLIDKTSGRPMRMDEEIKKLF